MVLYRAPQNNKFVTFLENCGIAYVIISCDIPVVRGTLICLLVVLMQGWSGTETKMMQLQT